MSTWGAGDPTSASPDGYHPWGAGAPTPPTFWAPQGADIGAGDPTLSILSAMILPAQPGDHLCPDDGGELLRIAAAWPAPGPFRVAIVEVHTGQTFDCYGGPGNGLDCQITPDGDLLCGLPAAPPGWYDLAITWGSGSHTVSSALRVIWRGRSLDQWALAARFRSADHPGPRSTRTAALLGV